MTEHFPRQFGKYVLLKSLARGGMGEIYLAASGYPGGLNKLCVIKKVIAGKTDRAKANRFLDEAKVVLRLSHGNLVSTFDAGDVRGELFIAMELVEGKDLREIWNRCVRTRTRIPVDVALVAVREVARALAYVHSYGGLRLVHRDVAPPNILLSYFGEVKLTDFGLARSILKQEHTAPGVVFGRASYLAPEQARGEMADARTDVYSLGIVLWELLTGQPYLQLAGLDPVTSLSLVRNPNPQPPSSRAPWIGPELDAVVLRALAPDRASSLPVRGGTAAGVVRGDEPGGAARRCRARRRVPARAVPRCRHRGERRARATAGRDHTGIAGRRCARGESVRARVRAAPRWRPPPPTEPTASRLMDPPKESLHVSALRARAGSQVRPVAQRRRAFSGRSVSAAAGASADRPARPHPLATHPPPCGGSGEARMARVARTRAQTFVGRVIDNRYRIHHRIGEGGMGTVYAAEHVEIGKSVAVKILHRILAGEEQLVERFKREARAASRVGHPHIIEVTDFGTTEEGCAYFVMELLEGTDLADVLVRETRLEPPRAVRIAVQICQALEAAHASGIIHRDLKPENIFLVARDGQADFVKVLDFGIARNLSGESRRLTNPGMAMGTPEYMAPEQSQGKPADRRSDVYAVGALLHEMVTGVAPFQAASQKEMLEAKRRTLPSLRGAHPDLPASIDAIIRRALAPDPEQRPQTMALLEYELGKIAWGRPQAVADLLGLKPGRRSTRWKGRRHPSLRRWTPRRRHLPWCCRARRLPAIQAMDFEKLLESDLPPAPAVRGRFAAPLSARRAVASGAASARQHGTAPWTAGLTTTLHGIGDEQAPRPRSEDTLSQIRSESALLPDSVPRMRRRSPVMLMLPVLAVVAGATAWATTTSTGSKLSREWARWVRDRVESARGAPPAAAATTGSAAKAGSRRVSAAALLRHLPPRVPS